MFIPDSRVAVQETVDHLKQFVCRAYFVTC